MNPFAQLQEELAGVIAADPLFAEVEVLWEERGDVLSLVNLAIQRQTRCVNILTPDADLSSPNLPGPFYDQVPVIIEVLGFPAVHQSDGGPTVRDMSHAIAALLHHYTPLASGQVMTAEKPAIANVETDINRAVLDHVRFNCPGLSTYEVPALELTADVAGDPVEFTCATPGVAIFYTLDGKHPSPRNGTLYTAPLSRPAAGTRLKARAWLAGYRPSNQINELIP